jgi:hypothetical protein
LADTDVDLREKSEAVTWKMNGAIAAAGAAIAEFWKVPALATGQQHDFTGSIQLTDFPKLSWHR